MLFFQLRFFQCHTVQLLFEIYTSTTQMSLWICDTEWYCKVLLSMISTTTIFLTIAYLARPFVLNFQQVLRRRFFTLISAIIYHYFICLLNMISDYIIFVAFWKGRFMFVFCDGAIAVSSLVS